MKDRQMHHESKACRGEYPTRRIASELRGHPVEIITAYGPKLTDNVLKATMFDAHFEVSELGYNNAAHAEQVCSRRHGLGEWDRVELKTSKMNPDLEMALKNITTDGAKNRKKRRKVSVAKEGAILTNRFIVCVRDGM